MIDESRLRRLCWLRSLEESGSAEPRVIAVADAELQRALEAGSPPDEALAARAAAAATAAGHDSRATLLATLAPTLVVAGAFLVGAFGDRLISGRELSLLSLPLFGLWAWNLLCYLTWTLGKISRSERTHAIAQWFARHLGQARQERLFWQATAPLKLARWQTTVHIAAIALVLGLLASMYVGGLALEYRTVWESTWLTAPQVQKLLDTILAPASQLAGIEVPDINNDRANDWIHLLAIQSLLIVGLPRAILATIERLRAARLERRLTPDLDAPYYRRLLGSARGISQRVIVVPFGFRPDRASLESLRALLTDTLGARTAIETLQPTDYGETPSLPPIEDPDRTRIVVLFNLAQTPENEVHGEALQQLASTHCRVVAAIDPSAYATTVDEQRRDRRSRTWNDVIVAHGAVAWPLPHPRYATAERELRDRALTAAIETLA